VLDQLISIVIIIIHGLNNELFARAIGLR